MACLNLTNGAFGNLIWSNAPTTNVGQVTVTLSGQTVTVARTGFAASINFSSGAGSPAPKYAVFGAANNVVVLTFSGAVEPFQRTVLLVDATGSTLTSHILLQVSLMNSQSLPIIASSPGNGSLLYVRTGTGSVNEITNVQIVRSDNADIVLNAFGPITLSGTDSAEITATQLTIHHPTSGSNDDTSIPRPAGLLSISPTSKAFGEAVLGASIPGLATITHSFVLTNDGDDCLTINGVPTVGAFSLTPASAALLPAILDPDETVTLDIVFAPSAVDNNIAETLTVNRSPANGSNTINCSGSARNAVASINATPSPVAFGTVPVGTLPTRTLTVSNSGEINVTVTVVAQPVAAASPFSWAGLAAAPLPVGGAAIPITITFAPIADGPVPNDSITVTPSAGTARTRTISGAGCVANATIQVPSVAPLVYGQIERGFRTVRFIEITNGGDGDLTFRARITPGANPAHAAFFGLTLPNNDITDAPATRNFSVLPTQRCGAGPVGTSVVAVAASFFADDVPGLYSANLVIDQHNDTVATASFTFPLSAEIIAPVPVDAVLVLDRSGSMADVIGVRQKSEAAVSAARLFVEMLRDNASDRAAIVRFNQTPEVVQAMLPIAGNRPAFQLAIAAGNFTPQGPTNIAGGVILGEVEQATPNPSPQTPKKAMIVLTDGMENRCFQVGGSGPWFSITGRDQSDPPDGMRRPDNTPQDSDPLPTPSSKVYAIGLGNPAQIDTAALDDLATATGARYDGVQELTASDFFLLEKYFTQIFMETAGLSQILDPFYNINPGDTHEIEFDIFAGDVNAMVVLYDEPNKRLPFFVVSPQGEVLSGASLPPGFSLRFHSTPTARFAEFFFPNKEPKRYEGKWKVVVRHDGRVCTGDLNDKEPGTVQPGFLPQKCRKSKDPVRYGVAIAAGSNLRLHAFVEPGTKYVGDTILLSGVVAEAGLPVTGASVKVTATTPFGQTFHLTLKDDGASQDGQVDDGEYAALFTKTLAAGNYQFLFDAQGIQAGKPWARQAQRTKVVLDRRRVPPHGDPKDEGGDRPPGGVDCCRKLVRQLSRTEALLRALLQDRPR